jgi:hypothetical protein
VSQDCPGRTQRISQFTLRTLWPSPTLASNSRKIISQVRSGVFRAHFARFYHFCKKHKNSKKKRKIKIESEFARTFEVTYYGTHEGKEY